MVGYDGISGSDVYKADCEFADSGVFIQET
jgi:hypothetical protein